MPTAPDDAPRDLCAAQAVALFTELADRLHAGGHAPREVGRLRDRLIVCLFMAHAGVLDREALSRVIDGAPGALSAMFQAVTRFELGMFADARILPLAGQELSLLRAAARLDWSAIEPTILGTLFECGLDPARRSRLGAHYTDREAIVLIIEPVIMTPLRREFAALQADPGSRDLLVERYQTYLTRLRGVRVLDPSCGAGHFLYHALQALQDHEREVIAWGAQRLDMPMRPLLGSGTVLGIECDAQAAELARLTLWIAELRGNVDRNDIPRLTRTIACRDAILELSAGGPPRRPVWPDAEFIVGNPPFLGGKKLRAGLGDGYVDRLFMAWSGRVPAEADLVSYWHEAAREQIAAGRCKRAALLATQAIRGGANLEVLRRIKASGDIFMAWRDIPWVTRGAAVRVSLVAQDDGSEQRRSLDGVAVTVIHADLTGGVARTPDVTRARRLRENRGVAFMGDTKGGKFELSAADAQQMLCVADEPGFLIRDVVVPWVNGLDVTRRPRGMHIVDFGVDMPHATAARYIGPYAFVQERVAPVRAMNRRDAYRERWWIHVEPRPALRAAIRPLRRFIATPTVARSRVFVWLTPPTLPDHQLIVVARDDDYCMGVLHSRIHELWSLRMCTWLGAGNDPRYTPTTTFETFPFPWPLDTPEVGLSARQRGHRDAIATVAESLQLARQRWQFPPELVVHGDPLAPGHPPRSIARDADAGRELKRRTLTALYRVRPPWLVALHAKLDHAVASAYGWSDDLDDETLIIRLLALNGERHGP